MSKSIIHAVMQQMAEFMRCSSNLATMRLLVHIQACTAAHTNAISTPLEAAASALCVPPAQSDSLQRRHAPLKSRGRWHRVARNTAKPRGAGNPHPAFPSAASQQTRVCTRCVVNEKKRPTQTYVSVDGQGQAGPRPSPLLLAVLLCHRGCAVAEGRRHLRRREGGTPLVEAELAEDDVEARQARCLPDDGCVVDRGVCQLHNIARRDKPAACVQATTQQVIKGQGGPGLHPRLSKMSRPLTATTALPLRVDVARCAHDQVATVQYTAQHSTHTHTHTRKEARRRAQELLRKAAQHSLVAQPQRLEIDRAVPRDPDDVARPAHHCLCFDILTILQSYGGGL